MAKTTTPCVAEAHFVTAAVNINKKIVFDIQLFRKKKKKTKEKKNKYKVNENMVNSFCSILSSQQKNRNLIVKPEFIFVADICFLLTIFFFFFFLFFLIGEYLKRIGKKFGQAVGRDVLCLMQEIMCTREHARRNLCIYRNVYLSRLNVLK